MNESLQNIIDKIQLTDPLHAKKLKRNLKNLNQDYLEKCEAFIAKYDRYLKGIDKDLEFGIECYQRMIADFMYEQLRFMETGKYSSTSFDEVNKRVYNNPEVMEYFMNGLLLSQVLWKHHYTMFSFFSSTFSKYTEGVKSYLEIGGGHGLFISKAIEILGTEVNFSLLDISPTSLEVSRQFIGEHPVNYILSDIFEFDTPLQYDFITMGEVLEHVEHPVDLMLKLRSLLSDEGTIFMTTPTNAPSIDHIYLFSNAEEIRTIIHQAGLEVVDEICVYAEDLPEEKAIELKVTMMYGCFLKKKQLN
jgi:2-polyprenyl-3-methyl-5-hydroxy-6-metoxy-1,4-benzoquinol methylase